MKYKVGDKVKIKSLDWYNANKDYNGQIKCSSSIFTPSMSLYCGKVTTIVNIERSIFYFLGIDDGLNEWFINMFEENFNDMQTKKIVLPDGWEIDRVENGEILLKESKKELPKTWEECYKQLIYSYNKA